MPTHRRMEAVVQSFHMDADHMTELAAGLDEAVERFSRSADFGGLICLERNEIRRQVTVIVLWAAEAMDAIDREVGDAHRRIASLTDFGVTTQTHRVVRFVPGAIDLTTLLQSPTITNSRQGAGRHHGAGPWEPERGT